MDCIKLPFGYHNGYMLQNNRQKSDIISDIIEKYKLNIFTMYEKNYSDHLLDVIKTKNMIVCPITKGKPYILYMTKIHNENVSLFIDLELMILDYLKLYHYHYLQMIVYLMVLFYMESYCDIKIIGVI